MNLTPRQKEVFDFIQSFIGENGHSPTHHDLMKQFGWKSPGTVQDMLKAIERRGYLSKESHTPNTMRVHDRPNSLPLLGKVAAGRPIAYHKYDEQIEVPSSMLKGSGDFFVLEVSGDSMINEGILEGDYVIVKKQSSAESGQIVVASLDDGATIKQFFKKAGHVELHSANPKYQPIVVNPHQQLNIEGLYCGLIRY